MEEESVPEQQLPAEVKDEFGRKRIFGQQGTLRLIECVRQRPKLWHRQYLRSRASGIEDWEEIQRTEFSTISGKEMSFKNLLQNNITIIFPFCSESVARALENTARLLPPGG